MMLSGFYHGLHFYFTLLSNVNTLILPKQTIFSRFSSERGVCFKGTQLAEVNWPG